MIRSTFFQTKAFYKLLNFHSLKAFSKKASSLAQINSSYKSPVVEERFYKKPIPKYSLGKIIRIENIIKNYESYYDKDGIVAGWARTVR